MPKFGNVVTIEVASGRRDQVITALLAHKARLKDEPGTLQFEILLPNDDDTKIHYVPGRRRVRGAFQRAVPRTMEKRNRRNGETSWGALHGLGLVDALTRGRRAALRN